MNHSLGILSSWVKFALHLVYFMTKFELQLYEATKYFSIFGFRLLEWKVVKDNAGDLWLRFCFLRYFWEKNPQKTRESKQ